MRGAVFAGGGGKVNHFIHDGVVAVVARVLLNAFDPRGLLAPYTDRRSIGTTKVVMSLEQINVVDAIGIDIQTGHAVLTIADSWDWSDEHGHLLALQEKLNVYFQFIESGQVWESYTAAKNRQLRINVVFRFSPPAVAIGFLAKAGATADELNVLVSHEIFSGSDA